MKHPGWDARPGQLLAWAIVARLPQDEQDEYVAYSGGGPLPTREVRRRRFIPSSVRREVLASGPCAFCGGPSAEVDHIVPISRGGRSGRENLQPTCKRCNRLKSNRSDEEHKAGLDALDEHLRRIVEQRD